MLRESHPTFSSDPDPDLRTLFPNVPNPLSNSIPTSPFLLKLSSRNNNTTQRKSTKRFKQCVRRAERRPGLRPAILFRQRLRLLCLISSCGRGLLVRRWTGRHRRFLSPSHLHPLPGLSERQVHRRAGKYHPRLHARDADGGGQRRAGPSDGPVRLAAHLSRSSAFPQRRRS